MHLEQAGSLSWFILNPSLMMSDVILCKALFFSIVDRKQMHPHNPLKISK